MRCAFVCGPPALVDDVPPLLRQLGQASADQIEIERYGEVPTVLKSRCTASAGARSAHDLAEFTAAPHDVIAGVDVEHFAGDAAAARVADQEEAGVADFAASMLRLSGERSR